MRGVHIAVILALAATWGCSKSDSGGATPEAVLETVFEAAKTGDTSKLAGLCDPQGSSDGDAREICGLTKDSPRFEKFKKQFARQTVVGAAEVKGDQARVSYAVSPKHYKRTVKLIQRDGRCRPQ